jgi:nucleotide-binding universal stress UspA family protein
MSMTKERLTVTVDPEFVEAGNDAVAEGRAESLSAWVNAALAERVAKERRLVALARAVTEYEERFGLISAQELADQARADRESAIVLRGSRAGRTRRKPRRRAAP